MDGPRRAFLDDLLATDTPSGFEGPGQRRWVEYVEGFADEVRTDAYGNAVAVLEGGEPSIALGGHGDEIGFLVRDVDDDGMLRLVPVGGADRTVSKGQHVLVHAADGPIRGVVGQAAIHLRDPTKDELEDIDRLHVDIGADDAADAEALVERGDPITFVQHVAELQHDRLTARGLDNRIGIWAAAEGLRRAAEQDPVATVYAVSTVQEEVGLQGAKMVGFDLAPDLYVAIDVTHATDAPGTPPGATSGITLGGGPVIARGGANHPAAVQAAREVAAAAGIDVQLEATGTRTGTDADAVFTARGAIPSLNVGVPNRYMHTPVEVLDLGDLDATADLVAGLAAAAHDYRFSVEF